MIKTLNFFVSRLAVSLPIILNNFVGLPSPEKIPCEKYKFIVEFQFTFITLFRDPAYF